MILTDILEKNAREIPDKTALTMRMGYRTVAPTYREVYVLAQKISVFLKKKGLQMGDKVLILAPNSPYWICVWWGCLLGGYVPVPLNIQSTPEMIKKIADQTDAKSIFKYLYYKQPLPENLKSFDIEFVKELTEDSNISSFRKADVNEDDIAELMYTSGTTGDPKGVILTHKNIGSNLEALLRLAPLSTTDKFLSILPLSHIFEQVIGFLLPFAKGLPIVYAHSPTAIRELLKEHSITIMAAVPAFLKVVMTKIEAAVKIKFFRRFVFPKFHTVISGGAPLDIDLEKKWNALGVNLLQGYGLTETSPVVSTNTYGNHRLGSVGKILPGTETKIVSDGEIWVKGPNVFQGYFKNEEKTKESFSDDGWFKTGDIGEIDKDGFLYIRGRKKYMLKGPGAQNVYPEDIEFELNKISGVTDSAVVGLEKANGQVEIHAVLLGDISDPEKIVAQANKNLATYQHIAGWSLWPEEDFPRSATRKVKKEQVIRWLKGRQFVPVEQYVKPKATPLMRLLAEVTGSDVGRILPDTKIVFELNLDSLLRVELASRIEEKLGITVDEAKITTETTVADLEAMLKKQEPIKKVPRLKKWPRSKLITLKRFFDQLLFIFPLTKIFVKLRVEGKENLENLSLPVIFMPNHLSYLDSLALIMALPFGIRKRIAFAAAQDVVYEKYRKTRWLAELFFNAFPFPRREHENIKAGLDYIGRLLDKGWSVVVYPEGQMSVTGELLPLKRGAGLIAVEMDAWVVPVRISGTARILPPGKFMPRARGEVMVKFGKPLKFKRSDSYIETTEKLEQAIKQIF